MEALAADKAKLPQPKKTVNPETSFSESDLFCLTTPGPMKGLEMFINALTSAIDAAYPKQIDYLSRQLWQAHAAGHIGDEDAQALAERLHGRRGVAQGALFRPGGSQTPPKPMGLPAGFKRAPEAKSPDRRRSIERRRRLAASGPMPPALAAQYTVGELAVLRIVGDEIHAKGTCTASLGEIAPRAGVCRKLVQLTLRRAARDGLITIERRPRPGRKNLTNVVRIISAEWLTWLRHRNHRPSGDRVQGEKKYLPRTKILGRGLAREDRSGRRLGETAGNGGTCNVTGPQCRTIASVTR
jgi:hypothetical protein